MKWSLLFFGAVLAACGSKPATHDAPPSRLVMRVDRALDVSVAKTGSPDGELADRDYAPLAPVDRWEVAFDDARVKLVPITHGRRAPRPDEGPLEGTLGAARPGERRYDLDKGAFAGGRFVVRDREAELTIYGSGVPIVSSERGTLVKK